VQLEVHGVSGGYGVTAQVLHDVGLHVEAGEVVALLGRNGVGKTSLLRAVMGLLPRAEGTVRIDGEDASGLPTHGRARRGLGYVPQGRDLFPNSSVEQNLRYGHLLAGGRMSNPLPAHLFEWFPWMRDRSDQRAGTLSGGEQQMVAIARMLVGRPKVLLLDEPTEGLAPVMVQQVAATIREIAGTEGPGMLLVEQNVTFALRLARRGYVMEKGRIVVEGPVDVLGSDEVVSRYLAI
jgi:urea transport system ATP-binding protein